MYVIRKRGSRSIERLQHEMEGTFRSMVVAGRPISVVVTTASGVQAAWRPPLEVYETETEIVVLAELAGMREDEIQVSIDDSVLTISGNRRPEGEDRPRSIHEMGIRYGDFAAEIFLPAPVMTDGIVASYEAGMLRVRLPKAEATRVSIRVEPA